MVSHASSPSPCGPERHSSPFHVRLSLSLDEKKELCRTAKRLVRDVIDGYERFLWVDHERLSPARWATVREREDVRVLHDRRPGAGTEDRDLNVLLTVGTVVGSLHDAMYGVVAQTTETMRLKTAYVQDTLRDCAVLATVQEPKAEKPFRSLTIKWLVKSVPLAARALTKHRDLVYMEATGMKRLSTGERVGFQLLHAVKFAQTPVLPQYIRHGMSSCCLWRQQTPERVQVYMKSYLEVPERLLAPLVIRSAADALISLWRYMHCAQMKKLAWLVRRKSSATPVMEEKAQHQHPFAAACCAVCDATTSSVRQAPAKAVCVVCARRVCDTCRVQRELFSVAPGGGGPLTARRVAVCVPCLTLAVRADAADVARDEIPGAPPQLAALVRVVGTRSSCPVVSDRERQRELERHRERRSVSVSVSAGPPGSRKTSFGNPLNSSGSSAGSSAGRGFQDRRAV